MSEKDLSTPIVERNSPILPFIKRMADELVTRAQQSPPMVVLLMHHLERPLLKDAIERIGKRFERKANKRLPATLFIEDASDATLEALATHRGPLAIDVDGMVFNPPVWSKIEKALLEECPHPYILLVSREDASELQNVGYLSKSVRSKICRSFFWPGPTMRSASMKRDYFLRHVALKAPKAYEALANNDEACRLVSDIFMDKGRGAFIANVLQCANAYVQHLENFDAKKHPVEVLAHFVTHVLDEARESAPPHGAEEDGINAA